MHTDGSAQRSQRLLTHHARRGGRGHPQVPAQPSLCPRDRAEPSALSATARLWPFSCRSDARASIPNLGEKTHQQTVSHPECLARTPACRALAAAGSLTTLPEARAPGRCTFVPIEPQLITEGRVPAARRLLTAPALTTSLRSGCDDGGESGSASRGASVKLPGRYFTNERRYVPSPCN